MGRSFATGQRADPASLFRKGVSRRAPQLRGPPQPKILPEALTLQPEIHPGDSFPRHFPNSIVHRRIPRWHLREYRTEDPIRAEGGRWEPKDQRRAMVLSPQENVPEGPRWGSLQNVACAQQFFPCSRLLRLFRRRRLGENTVGETGVYREGTAFAESADLLASELHQRRSGKHRDAFPRLAERFHPRLGTVSALSDGDQAGK